MSKKSDSSNSIDENVKVKSKSKKSNKLQPHSLHLSNNVKLNSSGDSTSSQFTSESSLSSLINEEPFDNNNCSVEINATHVQSLNIAMPHNLLSSNMDNYRSTMFTKFNNHKPQNNPKNVIINSNSFIPENLSVSNKPLLYSSPDVTNIPPTFCTLSSALCSHTINNNFLAHKIRPSISSYENKPLNNNSPSHIIMIDEDDFNSNSNLVKDDFISFNNNKDARGPNHYDNLHGGANNPTTVANYQTDDISNTRRDYTKSEFSDNLPNEKSWDWDTMATTLNTENTDTDTNGVNALIDNDVAPLKARPTYQVDEKIPFSFNFEASFFIPQGGRDAANLETMAQPSFMERGEESHLLLPNREEDEGDLTNQTLLADDLKNDYDKNSDDPFTKSKETNRPKISPLPNDHEYATISYFPSNQTSSSSSQHHQHQQEPPITLIELMPSNYGQSLRSSSPAMEQVDHADPPPNRSGGIFDNFSNILGKFPSTRHTLPITFNNYLRYSHIDENNSNNIENVNHKSDRYYDRLNSEEEASSTNGNAIYDTSNNHNYGTISNNGGNKKKKQGNNITSNKTNNNNNNNSSQQLAHHPSINTPPLLYNSSLYNGLSNISNDHDMLSYNDGATFRSQDIKTYYGNSYNSVATCTSKVRKSNLKKSQNKNVLNSYMTHGDIHAWDINNVINFIEGNRRNGLTAASNAPTSSSRNSNSTLPSHHHTILTQQNGTKKKNQLLLQTSSNCHNNSNDTRRVINNNNNNLGEVEQFSTIDDGNNSLSHRNIRGPSPTEDNSSNINNNNNTQFLRSSSLGRNSESPIVNQINEQENIKKHFSSEDVQHLCNDDNNLGSETFTSQISKRVDSSQDNEPGIRYSYDGSLSVRSDEGYSTPPQEFQDTNFQIVTKKQHKKHATTSIMNTQNNSSVLKHKCGKLPGPSSSIVTDYNLTQQHVTTDSAATTSTTTTSAEAEPNIKRLPTQTPLNHVSKVHYDNTTNKPSLTHYNSDGGKKHHPSHDASHNSQNPYNYQANNSSSNAIALAKRNNNFNLNDQGSLNGANQTQPNKKSNSKNTGSSFSTSINLTADNAASDNPTESIHPKTKPSTKATSINLQVNTPQQQALTTNEEDAKHSSQEVIRNNQSLLQPTISSVLVHNNTHMNNMSSNDQFSEQDFPLLKSNIKISSASVSLSSRNAPEDAVPPLQTFQRVGGSMTSNTLNVVISKTSIENRPQSALPSSKQRLQQCDFNNSVTANFDNVNKAKTFKPIPKSKINDSNQCLHLSTQPSRDAKNSNSPEFVFGFDVDENLMAQVMSDDNSPINLPLPVNTKDKTQTTNETFPNENINILTDSGQLPIIGDIEYLYKYHQKIWAEVEARLAAKKSNRN